MAIYVSVTKMEGARRRRRSLSSRRQISDCDADQALMAYLPAVPPRERQQIQAAAVARAEAAGAGNALASVPAMDNSATSWQRHTSNRHLLLADAKPRLLSEPTGLQGITMGRDALRRHPALRPPADAMGWSA